MAPSVDTASPFPFIGLDIKCNSSWHASDWPLVGQPSPPLPLLIRPAAVSHRPLWQIYRRGGLISASESPRPVPPVHRISLYFPSTCAFATINQPNKPPPLIRQIPRRQPRIAPPTFPGVCPVLCDVPSSAVNRFALEAFLLLHDSLIFLANLKWFQARINVFLYFNVLRWKVYIVVSWDILMIM